MLYNDFHRRIERVFHSSFPLIKLSKKKSHDKPWYDKNCRKAFCKKVKSYNKYKKTIPLKIKKIMLSSI